MFVFDIVGRIAFVMAGALTARYSCFGVTILLCLIVMKYDIYLPIL